MTHNFCNRDVCLSLIREAPLRVAATSTRHGKQENQQTFRQSVSALAARRNQGGDRRSFALNRLRKSPLFVALCL